jgi:hypothetical protein
MNGEIWPEGRTGEDGFNALDDETCPELDAPEPWDIRIIRSP